MMLSSPAPGVWRAGDALVTFYRVAEGSDLTLVDAGLPGHWDQLSAALATLGRSLQDIRAVLVTHAHPDHSGLAERLRSVAGAHVWVHALDAPMTLQLERLTARRAWDQADRDTQEAGGPDGPVPDANLTADLGATTELPA